MKRAKSEKYCAAEFVSVSEEGEREERERECERGREGVGERARVSE